MDLPRLPARSTLTACLTLLTACGEDAGTGPSPGPAAVLALGGQHACHADESGTRCWGAGSEGQLGIGLTPADTTPVLLSGAPVFVQLVAGADHTCGLDAEGLAYCWGSNSDGQLGTTSTLQQCPLPCALTPEPVAGQLRFLTLTAGRRHTCGIALDGRAHCWGLNDVGQLGVAEAGQTCVDGPCSRIPVAVQSAHSFIAVTAGIYHSCAVEAGGDAFCWGFHPGTTEGGNRIPQFRPEVRSVPGVAFRQISAGGWHTCGATGADVGYCWGIDAIGAGPTPLESDLPVAVGGGHRFRTVYSGGSTSCGLEQNGTAYCWGPNVNGEVGVEPAGSAVRYDLPVPVSGGLRFTTLAAGESSYCGITASEAIACWGKGTSGQLGSGHLDSARPITVPGL